MTERVMADTTIELRRTYDAPRLRVFAAFTEPDLLRQWYAPVEGWVVSIAEVDLRVGGGYHLEFGPPGDARVVERATYVEIVPGERLVFEMNLELRSGAVERTRTTIEFVERDGRTEVHLVEEGYSSTEIRDMHAGGWMRMLDQLGAALTG